jgi:hypothetical protein
MRTMSQRIERIALVALLATVTVAAVLRWDPVLVRSASALPSQAPEVHARLIVVRPTESIAEAMNLATPGSQVVVEPGEYRERLALRTASA